jgi:hypothetical protein
VHIGLVYLLNSNGSHFFLRMQKALDDIEYPQTF